LTLGFGDIGAPFEEIRGERSFKVGRLGGERALRDVEIRSGLAGENGDGILKLLALLAEKNRLSARSVEERLFLSDVEAGGDATSVTRVDEIQPLLECFHGTPQKSDLRIQLAQGEIVGGEFRGENQANAFEVSGVGLIGGLRRFDGAAALADKIHFIAHRKGE